MLFVAVAVRAWQMHLRREVALIFIRCNVSFAILLRYVLSSVLR